MAAMRSAWSFDLSDAAARASRPSPQLKITCRAEASLCDSVFIVQCLCWAGCSLGMSRRCLSTSRLNLGIHLGFHVMSLIDSPDQKVCKEPDDQQSGHDVHGGVVSPGLRHPMGHVVFADVIDQHWPCDAGRRPCCQKNAVNGADVSS